MLTLPDGKVLSFGTNEYGMQGASFIFDVYDPETDAHYTPTNPLPTDIFCSHMALDPVTGNVLIFGGDARKSVEGGGLDGVNSLSIFNPKTFELSASPKTMEFARWYPSVVTLSNGEILTVGGRNHAKNGSSIPEVWNAVTGFRSLTGAEIPNMVGNPEDADDQDVLDEAWWYPHVFQRSNGDVVVIEAYGHDVYIMTTEGVGTITEVGALPFESHKMDPSLMYDVDKVLMVDIDGNLWSVDLMPDDPDELNIPTYHLVWESPDDGHGRTAGNMNVLPDGSVLITGGTDYDNAWAEQGSNAAALEEAQYQALRFVPSTGELVVLEAEDIARLYHSAAVQLEDGRIISGGGGAPGPLQNLNVQIFTPDIYYNVDGWLALQPEITAITKVVEAGGQIMINVDDADAIASVGAVKSGAVTHSTNSDTRYVGLEFTAVDATTLVAEVPDSNVMIPGHWMISVVNDDGVPSRYASIGVEVAQDFFEGFGRFSHHPLPPREDQPDINGAFTVDALVRFDDLGGGQWQRVFDFGNGPAEDNILLGQVAGSNTMRFEIYDGANSSILDVPDAIVEGETALFTASVDNNGFMSLKKDGILLGEAQGIVPSDVDRTTELVGASLWVADDPLDGEVHSLAFTGSVDHPDDVVFYAEATARFDDIDGGSWQRIFDHGSGPATDNVLLGQVGNTDTMRFSMWQDDVEYPLDVPGAIVEGEVATWTALITRRGALKLYKDDLLVDQRSAVPPSQDAARANKLVGASNWDADTPLIGDVLSIVVDDDCLGDEVFYAEATARFDDIDGGSWQRVFDYGSGPASDNVLLGQVWNTDTMRFSMWQDGVEYALDVPGAIIEGEVATWTALITWDGLLELYKNDVLLGELWAVAPSEDAARLNKLVGESNWNADTPLIGEVLSIIVDQ